MLDIKKLKIMKFIYKILVLFIGVTLLYSCEENEIATVDIENGRAIAGFNGGTESPTIIFNPSADTENIITVGVSTISGNDRQVQLSIDESLTTLSESYYDISTLSPVIPAGELTVDVVVKTIASTEVPASSSKLVIKLDSIENAEILTGSIDMVDIGLNVQCPEVDVSSIPGMYQITTDEFGTLVGEDNTFEVVAGPGDSEFTLVNPFHHPNPDAGGAENYEVVVQIDPQTGKLSVDRQAAWHYSNLADSPAYGEGRVEGSGQALTCIGQLKFNLTNIVDAGSFGSSSLVVDKI